MDKVEVVKIPLHRNSYIPRSIEDFIQNSFVFSEKELKEAMEKGKDLYLLYSDDGEVAGFCVAIKAYPHEVTAELKTSITEKILWVDALEIKQEYQGRQLGTLLFRYIKNSFNGCVFLFSLVEAVPFWEKMGLGVIYWSGEAAYMIS
ncbi:MAG: hypothetical protein K0R55_488 [Sporomusa sp.]|nr:hypothetical protein [Sporomusa sp.]